MVKDVQKQNELYEFLLDFGLSEREITLYLTLLKTGPNTIMNLSRETGIKRSTTHNNVEELIKKGLVSQTNYGERRMVIAEDPDKLQFLLEQKKYKMKKMEENLPGVVNQIIKLVPTNKDKNVVEVKYFQGVEGFRDLCNRSLNLAKGEVLFISNPEEWRKVFTEDYDNTVYIPRRLEKGLKVRTLLLNTDISESIAKSGKDIKRETRFLPEGFNFGVTTIIYQNEVSIMVSSEPYTAILLESKEIYETYKNLFENLWNMSEKVT